MAGDWIKMRVNLVTHPKVLAISDLLVEDDRYQDWSTMSGFVPAIGGTRQEAEDDFVASLRVTRYVTVGGLLRFWGYANEHAKDEFIGNLRVGDLDEITQIPGFGMALEAVGWVAYNKDRRGIDLPGFNEYNTSGSERSAGAKSAAQRQKEYRERKRLAESSQQSDVTNDVTNDVTSNRREEKNREEKKDIESEQKKKASQLPKDFQPDDFCIAKCRELGLNMAAELEKFRDHHLAHGTKFLNWQAGFNKWLGNAPGFQRVGHGQQAAPAFDPDSRSAIEAEGEAKGLGRWDELKEQWPAYKARVRGTQTKFIPLDQLASMAQHKGAMQ